MKPKTLKAYQAYYYLWFVRWENGEYHEARKPWRTRRIGCLRQCWAHPIKPGKWISRYMTPRRKPWMATEW